MFRELPGGSAGLSDFHFHPCLGDGTIRFIRSTNSNVNLIQKHPHRLN